MGSHIEDCVPFCGKELDIMKDAKGRANSFLISMRFMVGKSVADSFARRRQSTQTWEASLPRI
jgi:hypothetical protein